MQLTSNPTSVTTVPEFRIGESDAPLSYLHAELPAFCRRLGMSSTDQKRFTEAGIASAEACVNLLEKDALIAGKIEPVPQARAFWNLVGDMLLEPQSQATGLENLRTAMRYLADGWNVVVVQNHRSGADMLVMETLIRRHFGEDICAEWSYMAGHAVNLFLIPLMFSAGLRRFQIFSVKYQSTGIPAMSLTKMKEQNQRALLALREHTAPGGKVTVYYPEGGRGDHVMKNGEPRTTCIPRNISENGKGLMILPTCVTGTERLLRPSRGQNEFNEVFNYMERGSAALAIGEPIAWDAIRDTNKRYEGDKKAWNKRVCDTLLALVAKLGPPEQAGPYCTNNAGNWALIAPLLNGGCL